MDILYDLTLLCLMFWFGWQALKVVRLWRKDVRIRKGWARGDELIKMGLPKGKE